MPGGVVVDRVDQRSGRSVRRMATGTRDVESELIESVCERVRERVAPEEVAEAEAFVRAYYRRAPAEDLRGREPVDLYGAALSHWTFGRDRGGRRDARARLQPDVRAARLAVAAHGDRSRQRRHAVPRGLGGDGAQPPRGRHPRARASGDRRRVLHAHRGRPAGGRARRAGRGACAACSRRCARRSRTGSRCASACRRSCRSSSRRRRPASTRPRSRRRARCWPGSPTTTSRSWATASTSSSTTSCTRSRTPASGCCAAAAEVPRPRSPSSRRPSARWRWSARRSC